MCDIEINIMDVVRKNGIKITGRSGESVRATCPACGGKSTLSITPSKNMWSCFRCGIGGNHVSLEYELNPQEYSGKNKYPLFIKNMEDYLGSGITKEREPVYIETREESSPEFDRASDEKCSAVYYAMLKLLQLKDEHKADLIKRGLTEEQIKIFRFKTSPTRNQRFSIPKQLISQGYALDGVPGFYKEGDKWALKTPAASYLCPVFDGHTNQILGFQPRLDKPIDGNKYTWLSSVGKPAGVTSGTLAGVLPGKYDKAIVIVEGTLKAIIVYCLLNKEITVVSVPGVNSLKCLEPVLSMYEGSVAFECYDMDKFLTKPIYNPETEEENKEARKIKNIQTAVVKLEEKCSEYNITVHHNWWNFEQIDWAKGKELGGLIKECPPYAITGLWNGEGKGLDDFLLEYKKPEIFAKHVIAKAEELLRMRNSLR